MKSGGRQMAGNARQLVLSSQSIWRIAALVLLLGSAAVSQELYKYQDENGDWIYTDKPPEDGQPMLTRC